MSETKVTSQVIETGRLAWNELSVIMDKDPVLFSVRQKKDFESFYYTLVQHLFEEETEE